MSKKNTVVTIEKTSKKYKGASVIGICAIIGGLVVALSISPSVGTLLCLVGLGITTYARIGAWWDNG